MKIYAVVAGLLMAFSSLAADVNITNVTRADVIPAGSYALGTTGLVTRLLPINLMSVSHATSADSVANSLVTPTNTAFGLNAFATGTGTNDTAFGARVLEHNTTGWVNVGVGYNALNDNTSGAGNVALGAQALQHNTTGFDNVAIGYIALYANTTGRNNIAIGSDALQANIDGNYNVAVGYQTLIESVSASQNTAVGKDSQMHNLDGVNNSSLGFNSLRNNTNGGYNTAIGVNAMDVMTNSSYGVAVGYNAAQTPQADYSTFLGASSDSATPGISYATAIGYGSRVTNSYQITVGRSSEKVVVPGSLSVSGNTTNLGVTYFGSSQQSQIGSDGVFSGSISSAAYVTTALLTNQIYYTNLVNGTNSSTTSINMTLPEADYMNTSFSLSGYVGLSQTNYQHQMLHLFYTGFGQSSATAITFPANTHVQGTANVTNQTDVQIDYNPLIPITNALCLPRW